MQDEAKTNRIRLAYLVSHPIQYQAPLLRRIALEPDIDLTVFFGSDFSVRGYQDKGFGVDVKWDVPLLEGYRYEFLPKLRDTATYSVTSPLSYGIWSRLRGRNGEPAFDALWTHGYATLNALHGMLAAKSLGIPVLVRAESWLADRSRSPWKLVAKQVFFHALRPFVDAVLPIGSLNAEYWRHYFGPQMPMFQMPYAVDNAYFQHQSELATNHREALRQELGLEPGRPIILFASKLQTRKRCSDLVEAYRRLCTQRKQTPVPYLLIVGDGEERAALQQQASATGLEGIRFCGFRNQSELPRFFDLASVFVLPSEHEPWGLIVNEVMNAARAVIVTQDVGSYVDLIADGVEGCVYPVRDIGALVVCLERVLASPETAAQMGERARQRIDQWSFEQDVAGLRAALAHITHRLPAERCHSTAAQPN
ncbi:MAG: glycosyltransferase family 4 protein [Acidobacteriota bacterium]|nr:glycosyltransferase family 4 protein [Acidobacteriota bacterium]